VIVSSQVSQAAAKNWKVPAALATSARVSLIGLPLSSRCSCASSSPRSRMPLAMRCSMPARSWRLRSGPGRLLAHAFGGLHRFVDIGAVAACSVATVLPSAGYSVV
jgi:hypothetical protein